MQHFAQTILIGNLGGDPVINETRDGTKVANISVCVNESYRDRNGEWQNKPHWFRCFTFIEAQVGYIERNLVEGTTVHIVATPETKKWVDRDVERTQVNFRLNEIRILKKKERRDDNTARGEQRQAPRESFSADLEDEIPF